MHISLFLPIHLLQKAIQERFDDPTDFMEMGENEQAFTEVQITPLSPIQLNTQRGIVESYLPLQAGVRLKREGNTLLASLPSLERVEMKLTVILRTALYLTPDWKLKAKSLVNYRWDEKPSWGGGFIKLPLSSLLEPSLDKELEKVARKVDEFIEKEVDLEEILWESWEALQAPIEVEAGGNQHIYLYLNLPGEQLPATDILMEKGKASIIFKLAFPQEKVIALPNKKDLPTPDHLPMYVREELNIRREKIQVEATYTMEDLEKILRELQVDMDHRSQLSFIDPKLRYEQGQLRLAAKIVGKYKRIPVNGVISCLAEISWAAKEQCFHVHEFSYHLAKANLALRLAHMLRKKFLQRQFRMLLEEELNQLWKEIKEAVHHNLEKAKLNAYVELSVSELQVLLLDAELSSSKLELLLEIGGLPSLEVTKLEF